MNAIKLLSVSYLMPAAVLMLCLSSFAVAKIDHELPLASVAVVAIDVDSGETLLSKHADVVLPIASLTKVMTALVVLESEAGMDEWLSIEDWQKKHAKNAYSRIRLTSKARRKDLLRIALMSSENRAAYNLAVHHPGGVSEFVAAMNNAAQRLGMTKSRFFDPTGLEVRNTSTAADLGRLLVAAQQHPLIKEYSTTRSFTVNFRSPRYRLGYGNTNPLLGSSRWEVGLTKTGYLSEAGRCLVMVTEMANRTIGLVTLNSLGKRSPLGDAGRVRRWLESGVRGSVAQAARDHEQKIKSKLGL